MRAALNGDTAVAGWTKRLPLLLRLTLIAGTVCIVGLTGNYVGLARMYSPGRERALRDRPGVGGARVSGGGDSWRSSRAPKPAAHADRGLAVDGEEGGSVRGTAAALLLTARGEAWGSLVHGGEREGGWALERPAPHTPGLSQPSQSGPSPRPRSAQCLP